MSHASYCKWPIGREAPEGKINRAGRENCQSIVHGQRSEGFISHHQLLKPLNGPKRRKELTSDTH